ncbi:MFS transporter [Humibacter soli]
MTREAAQQLAEAQRARRGLGVVLAGPFSSLRGNPRFRLLWFSNLFFFGGVWTQTLVMSWLAFEMTHSDLLVAVFGAARLSPMFLGPVAGALADRHNRVRLLLIACGWATVAVSVVGALASAGILSYWMLVVGGFAIGLAQSPSQPARASLVLDLVGSENLSNANALNALAMNSTQVIGPAIGGVLIAAIGAPAALWVSVGWYLISFALMIPLRGVPNPPYEGQPVLRMVVSGMRIIGRDRLTMAVLLITFAANTLLWPIYQSFMPVFAQDSFHLNAAGLGALLTVCGLGGLIGSLIIAALGDFRFKGALFVFGTAAWALFWILFASIANVPVAFVMLGLVGLASAAFNVLQTTLLLLTTGPELHGRVLGLQELAIGIQPVSTLVLGAIASLIGVALTASAAGALLIAFVAILAWRVPQLVRFSGVQDQGGST